MKKYLFILFIIFSNLDANSDIVLLPEEQKEFDKNYEFYKNDKYAPPPSIESSKKKKEKNIDIGLGVDVNKEKKEVDSIKLDLGTKF